MQSRSRLPFLVFALVGRNLNLRAHQACLHAAAPMSPKARQRTMSLIRQPRRSPAKRYVRSSQFVLATLLPSNGVPLRQASPGLAAKKRKAAEKPSGSSMDAPMLGEAVCAILAFALAVDIA